MESGLWCRSGCGERSGVDAVIQGSDLTLGGNKNEGGSRSSRGRAGRSRGWMGWGGDEKERGGDGSQVWAEQRANRFLRKDEVPSSPPSPQALPRLLLHETGPGSS